MRVVYLPLRWIVPATALLCLLATAAPAVDGVFEINDTCARFSGTGCFPGDDPEPPVTITQPGSYVLTSNLVIPGQDMDAIRIQSNDVTLDLNGYTVQGPDTGGGAGNGVYALDRFNLTIRNGRIWGFGADGIQLRNTVGHPSDNRPGHHIEAMHVANNGVGVVMNGGIIIASTVDGNRQAGISAGATAVHDATANKNGANGFVLVQSSATNCVAIGNGKKGFELEKSSLTGCVAIENGTFGIYMYRSSVTGCRIQENGDMGISMETVYGANYVFRNSASGNLGASQINCPNNGTDNLCVDNASF